MEPFLDLDVESRMKIDGRILDHKTLEAIRLMAIERVQAGESPVTVIEAYGFHRTTIYKWIRTALASKKGTESLRSTKGTGRPRSLTPRQEAQVFRWINGRDPRQYGLDFGLWTRNIVSDLIERKYGVRLCVSTVGYLLNKMGLTPQKPLQRAYQRNPDAIELWKRETFPRIARKAKATNADIFFWDESGFRADTVHGKTWGVRGQTPIVERPGQRQSISAASAVNEKGAFWFCTYEGALNGELFVELLQKMMHRRRRPVHLVVDGLPVHRRVLVRDYVDSTNGMLTLHFLPGYAPELNPDELVWSYVKRTGTARRPLRKGENLREKIEEQLLKLQNIPHLIRSFFQSPFVAYINAR